MRRDTKILYGSIMILTTIVVVSSLFLVLQFEYAENLAQPDVTAPPVEPNADITSELVVLHQAVPVTVDRFNITLELTAHKKINNTAIETAISIITPEISTPTILQYTGVGESQTTADNYLVRVINATDSTVQVLVGK
ncbi:MAG: hypothetical protein ACD_43C00115G0004 [uncultured bacterium]|nr:MAG: hypothetical protein ACD_43C00115G0004 [uncultured bacterium]